MTIANRFGLLVLPSFWAVVAVAGAETSAPAAATEPLARVEIVDTRGDQSDPLFDDEYEEGDDKFADDFVEKQDITDDYLKIEEMVDDDDNNYL